MIDPAWDNLDIQEFLDHGETKENREHMEREANLEHQEAWDLLVSQVLRAHLVYLVSRVSEGPPALTERRASRALRGRPGTQEPWGHLDCPD